MRILFWVAIIYLAYRWFYRGSVLEAAMKQQKQGDRPQQMNKPPKQDAASTPKADEGEYVDFEEVE